MPLPWFFTLFQCVTFGLLIQKNFRRWVGVLQINGIAGVDLPPPTVWTKATFSIMSTHLFSKLPSLHWLSLYLFVLLRLLLLKPGSTAQNHSLVSMFGTFPFILLFFILSPIPLQSFQIRTLDKLSLSNPTAPCLFQHTGPGFFETSLGWLHAPTPTH